MTYDDGEVRQQFSMCLACRRLGGEASAESDESLVVRLVAVEDADALEVSPAIRLRINDYLAEQ